MSDPVALTRTPATHLCSPAAAAGTAPAAPARLPDTRAALDAVKQQLQCLGLTTRAEQGRTPTAWSTHEPTGRSMLQRYAHALKLDGPVQAQVDRSVGRALSFLQQLKQTPGLSMQQREVLSGTWLELAGKGDSRQDAFARILRLPGLPTLLDAGQLRQYGQALARIPWSADFPVEAGKLGSLVNHPMFRAASAEGRSNALANPARALSLLTVKYLPLDRAQARKDIAQVLAERAPGIKPAAAQAMQANLMALYDRTMSRYFEAEPSRRAAFGTNHWYGELLEKATGSDWAEKLRHVYMTQVKTNACLAVFGAQPTCNPDRD